MPTECIPTCVKSTTFHGLRKGPKLLITGAVHGNELAGTVAIEQTIRDIEEGRIHLTRGSVTFIPRTNPLAVERKSRMGDRNLNRNMCVKAIPQDFEDRVSNVLCPILDTHDVLLDLHSFHSPGEPFVLIGPADNDGDLEPFHQHAQELALAMHAGPYRVLEGWLDVYSRGIERRLQEASDAATSATTNATTGTGTGSSAGRSLQTDTNYGVGTTEYMRSGGGYGITLECGQHDDPAGPAVARVAIERTLAVLGMSDAFPLLPLTPPASEREILTLVDVVDCNDVGDSFARDWSSFDFVIEGTVIGTRVDGTAVTAEHDGHVVFPNKNALPGAEWFYFAVRRGTE